MKVRSNALSLLASVGITAYCAHAATGDPVPPPSLRDLDLVEKPWPELASSWRHFLPAHEPGANQPAPDPSQEGNWPAGVAPFLGGAEGGFRGTMRAQNSEKSLLGAGAGVSVHPTSTNRLNQGAEPAGLGLDPAFSAGLASLKHAIGFIEDSQSSIDWKPNLQLLVGVKAVEGSKRTIYFVQLTTLPTPPPTTNSEPWQPILRTNDWAWSASNKAQFVTSLYPVRVRVFDETGRRLKEGQTPMAWGMLTNGLMDLCRLGFEAYHHEGQTNAPFTASPSSSPSPPVVEKVPAGQLRGKPQDNDALARATGGGFLWMIGMLYDLQTVQAVADVWAKAQCAIRRPSAWAIATSVVKGLTFSIDIEPRLKEVTLANAATAGHAEPLYRLPVDLNSGKRNLTRVEISVGPAHGAGMLLAGIRSIRAKHPTKPKQEFLAQVLAAGAVREP